MSAPGSPFKPPTAHDIRTISGSEMIKRQSIRRIVTRLRSTDFVKTIVIVTETKRFDGEVVQHGPFECGTDKFVFNINQDMYGSDLLFKVTEEDRRNNVMSNSFQFEARAVFTSAEMVKLTAHIEAMVDPDSMELAQFYRDNDPEDEERCARENNGCFQHMRKLKSGNRASPLHGQINIIYMNTKLKSGQLPTTSFWGTILRAYIASQILNENSCAFLSGMHCYKSCMHEEWHARAHYISITLCQKGSALYKTCKRLGLKLLDLENNNILRWDKEANRIYCAAKLKMFGNQLFAHDVYVEIMLGDTSVRIEDGEMNICTKRESSGLHKSFLECRACGFHEICNRESSDEENAMDTDDEH